MRFAVQSIVFGKDKDKAELIEMCREIRDCGYRGIEFFQNLKQFGSTKELADVLRDLELVLVGVATGPLRDRIAFVRDYCRQLRKSTEDVDSPYVYVDEWDDTVCDRALHNGIRIAIHPHMFRQIQTEREARHFLSRYPKDNFRHLTLMPDTAHSTIAGDKPERMIIDHFDRIHSIHFKDWNPNVGKSYQFYSSGFCRFGMGAVPLEECLRELYRRSYRGWVIVEHDTSETPRTEIEGSLNWLRARLPPGFVDVRSR
jgi:sugar phosphate isomerase/epimerase